MKRLFPIALLVFVVGAISAQAGTAFRLKIIGKVRNVDSKVVEVETTTKIVKLARGAFPVWVDFHPGDQIQMLAFRDSILSILDKKDPKAAAH